MRAIPAAAILAALVISPLAAAQSSPTSSPLERGPAPSLAQVTPRLSPEEVVRRALAQSPAVRGARANRDTASAESNSLRGHLLPGISFSDEAQHWDSAFVVPFPTGSKGVVDGFIPVTARDQNTNTLIVSVGQPLLGLLHLGADFAATRSLVGSAEADVRTGEAAVKEGALAQLLTLFEARELVQIAHASVGQLAEQLQVAQARAAAGVATRADVLRIATAAANARQQEIEAAAQEESARAALLVTIGEAPDVTGVDFEAPVLPEPEVAPALPDALRIAVARRPELESARVAHEAAQSRLHARTFDLLPEVSAEAAYLHVTGNAFQPEDSAFVGIKVDLPVWEWGAKWYARSAAAARADAAAAREAGVHDQVSMEVSGRLAAVRAAASAITVARTAIASAEEAYRVTDALVKAGSATTTDLLDAQAALTTARSNLARAGYSYALRRVNLARATGEL